MTDNNEQKFAKRLLQILGQNPIREAKKGTVIMSLMIVIISIFLVLVKTNILKLP